MAVVGLSVACAGWAYTKVQTEQRHARQELDRVTGMLAQMQARLDRPAPLVIGHAFERPRAEADAPAAAAEMESDNPGTPAREIPITHEQSQKRVLAAFATEAVDSTWGPDATRRLDGIVRAHLPAGSRLGNVECHATMCAVQVTHPDANALGEWLRKGFRGWPGSIFVTSEQDQRGELAVTIIASREGTEPPIAPR